jgi:hypothetical protein
LAATLLADGAPCFAICACPALVIKRDCSYISIHFSVEIAEISGMQTSWRESPGYLDRVGSIQCFRIRLCAFGLESHRIHNGFYPRARGTVSSETPPPLATPFWARMTRGAPVLREALCPHTGRT